MSITCITCGTAMPDNSGFCPSCGRAVQLLRPANATVARVPVAPATESKPSAAKSSEEQDVIPEAETQAGPPVIWNDRLFATAAYFTFIPAVALLFIKPYAQRQFVRFHSLQSILFWVLVSALVGIGVLASTFGFLLLWLFAGTLVVLALSLTWLVLSIKALQGEWFRLPGLGQLAEQYAAIR
jgi:uncharacterized membrane protein